MAMRVGNILRRCAANFPTKHALVYGQRRVSYDALNRRVNSLANSLVKMGLQKADRVAVLLHNCPEFFEVYFACAKLGAILVPLNFRLVGRELEDQLEVRHSMGSNYRDAEQRIAFLTGRIEALTMANALEHEQVAQSHGEAALDDADRRGHCHDARGTALLRVRGLGRFGRIRSGIKVA